MNFIKYFNYIMGEVNYDQLDKNKCYSKIIERSRWNPSQRAYLGKYIETKTVTETTTMKYIEKKNMDGELINDTWTQIKKDEVDGIQDNMNDPSTFMFKGHDFKMADRYIDIKSGEIGSSHKQTKIQVT